MGCVSPICVKLPEIIVSQFKDIFCQRKNFGLSPSTVHNIVNIFRESREIAVCKCQWRKRCWMHVTIEPSGGNVWGTITLPWWTYPHGLGSTNSHTQIIVTQCSLHFSNIRTFLVRQVDKVGRRVCLHLWIQRLLKKRKKGASRVFYFCLFLVVLCSCLLLSLASLDWTCFVSRWLWFFFVYALCSGLWLHNCLLFD